tara:strand:+ start:386 stop:2092 length:1707 start_codon:yes stop_codon:yes gene_type:complete
MILIIQKIIIQFKKQIFYLGRFSLLFIFFLSNKLVNKTAKHKRIIDNPAFKLSSFYENNDRVFSDTTFLPYENINIFTRLGFNRSYEGVKTTFLLSRNSKVIKFKPSNSILLPIAILDNQCFANSPSRIINLFFDKNEHPIEIAHANRYYYIPIKTKKEIDEIKVCSNSSNVVIGKPVSNNFSNNKPNLIVHLTIDSLAQSLIDIHGFDLMPNTKKYFEKSGIKFTNTYAQSEWTLPSIAGIFTGLYTNEHFLYHPKYKKVILHNTLADHLSKGGYHTCCITTMPRISPKHGFHKGFDKFIYAPDHDANFILNQALEHLEVYKCKKYLFLGIFDLHQMDHLQSISIQASADLEDFKLIGKNPKSKSKVSPFYDKKKIKFLEYSVRSLDKKLLSLYQAIDKQDKNALVILHSDHGVNYMTKTKEELSKEKAKVIFLYRNNSFGGEVKEIKEIRELPYLLCNDISDVEKFGYKKNKFSITESLYPKRDYQIAVRSNTHVLFQKIKWKNVIKGNYLPFSTTLHEIGNEALILEKSNPVYKELCVVAKNHFINMQKNRNEMTKDLLKKGIPL